VLAGLLGIGLLTTAVDQIVQPRSAIGYLSVQRILSDSLDAKAAAKRLEELRLARATDIGARQKTLEATRLEEANAGGMFRASSRARLKAQGDQQQKEIQEATQRAQIEFLNLQRQLQADLQRELDSVVGDLARRHAVQLVLNKDSVVWSST